jgi:hypothetical protein
MVRTDLQRPRPSSLLTFVWALFFFLLFAVVVMLWVRCSGPRQTVDDQRANARKTKLADLRKADAERLTTAGWIDQAKGIVHLPIEDAKKLVLAELRGKKPVASQVKVEPPLPMPPPFDPAAAEPPPPPLPSAPQGADTMHFGPTPSPAVAAPAAPAAVPAPGAPAQPNVPKPAGTPANPPPPAAAPPPSTAPAPARPPLLNSNPAQ